MDCGHRKETFRNVGYYRRKATTTEVADITILETRRERDDAVADALAQREEVKRLCEMVTDLKQRLENTETYIEKEHIAAWAKVQKALPPQPMGSDLSLCDYVIQQIQQIQQLHRFREINKNLSEQRDELLLKVERREKDVSAYGEFAHNVASALGMSTYRISFKYLLQRVKGVQKDSIRYENYWIEACEKIKTLTAERNALHAERDSLKEELVKTMPPEPQYRMLGVGECIHKDDEYGLNGLWGSTIRAGDVVSEAYAGRYRRRVNPLDKSTPA